MNDILKYSDDDEEDTGKSRHFKIMERSSVQIETEVEFAHTVSVDPFHYVDLLAYLRNPPGNVVRININLNNYGGGLDAGIPLYNAILGCPVPTQTTVTGRCYSMGALLALAGHNMVMNQYSHLMFHNYSGGVSGKGGEIITGAQHDAKFLATVFRDMTSPFLTKSEVDKILRDGDVYVSWDDPDLLTRMRRHFRRRQ